MIQYFSTKNSQKKIPFQEAVIKGMPADNGLYFPDNIPVLPKSIIEANLSIQEIGLEIATPFLEDNFSCNEIADMIHKAINFDVPVIPLKDFHLTITELFHGPTAAFKDFGARFMSQVIGAYLEKSQKDIVILVATSGDTGGAIGSAFFEIPHTKVVILYPSRKISSLQEKQLTTLGSNVSALEIQGTFDDCQHLVKTAFLDDELNKKLHLTSANSINIARLIPQSFYYAFVSQQLWNVSKMKVCFSVPSGNFGNLTAGLMAKQFGFPIDHFIGSVNANSVFADYMTTGFFTPQKSKHTMSNAMDVGNPSNFARLAYWFDNKVENFRNEITSYSFSDTETKKAIEEVYKKYNYIICPHTAVGYLGWKEYSQTNPDAIGNVLSTAHPAKFPEIVELIIDKTLLPPKQLIETLQKPKHSTLLTTKYNDLKEYLEGMK